MLAVASSNTNILGFRSRALPMQISWRCPALKFSPASTTISCNWPGKDFTCFFMSTLSNTDHSSVSEWLSNGSKLKRTVAEKSTGSCGTMPTRDRSVCKGIVLVSMPPMSICPPASSWMRNSAFIKLLLPDPVRPAMPTFSPASTTKLSPLRMRGPSRYRIWMLRLSTLPSNGQLPGTGAADLSLPFISSSLRKIPSCSTCSE
mmetsp:Transcript_7696/g.10912  ORF Transcript_7696/g.10912 Transcript_7696/m.10912 type:complete len:203 (+) Transcript_7696:1216-1824(+)